MQYISKNTEETLAWARKLASNFRGGEIIGLDGNLGAGKTVVVKGLAMGLGVKQVVNSPTFVLMKVYPVKAKTSQQQKIKHLVHVDTYRLSSPDELLAIGLQDYLKDKSSVVVIEWAEKIKKIMPQSTKYIKLTNLDENSRQIEF